MGDNFFDFEHFASCSSCGKRYTRDEVAQLRFTSDGSGLICPRCGKKGLLILQSGQKQYVSRRA